MALVWNEGEIVTLYNMEQQGVYVSVKFEPQIIGYQKRQVGRAMYDFENALIGSPDGQSPNEATPSMPNRPAHHNVGGHPIRQRDMELLALTKLTGNSRADYQGNIPEPWWPEHIIQKVTVEGTSIKFDPNIKAWRGRLFINAHIANAGFGGLD